MKRKLYTVYIDFESIAEQIEADSGEEAIEIMTNILLKERKQGIFRTQSDCWVADYFDDDDEFLH